MVNRATFREDEGGSGGRADERLCDSLLSPGEDYQMCFSYPRYLIAPYPSFENASRPLQRLPNFPTPSLTYPATSIFPLLVGELSNEENDIELI